MVNERLVKIKEDARYDVAKFSKEFNNKYGVYPVVMYKIVNDNQNLKIVPIDKVEKIVDRLIKDYYGENYSIWLRKRYKFLMEYKQVMFKILYDMGYTYSVLSKYFKYAHCTILYSNNTVNGYIKIKDEKIINIYNQILYEINKESGTFDIIQWDDPGKTNP